MEQTSQPTKWAYRVVVPGDGEAEPGVRRTNLNRAHEVGERQTMQENRLKTDLNKCYQLLDRQLDDLHAPHFNPGQRNM